MNTCDNNLLLVEIKKNSQRRLNVLKYYRMYILRKLYVAIDKYYKS